MLFETKFERATRGIVCGPAVLPDLLFTGMRVRAQRIGFDLKADAVPEKAPGVYVHHTVSILSREMGEELWVRPFVSWYDAVVTYLRIIGIDPTEALGRPVALPSTWVDGDLLVRIATVTSYTSTTNNSGADWSAGGTLAPSNVTNTVSYLVVSGGGGGHSNNSSAYAGGGGAGGMLTSSASVSAATNYAVTVGAGGAGGVSTGNGTSGSASSWNSIAPTGGGGGSITYFNGTSYQGFNALNGGSGGGTGYYNAGSPIAGTGTAGQGNNGANYASGGSGGGGGGAGAAATSGAGGAGLASSISGSSVTYAAGGNTGTGTAGTNTLGNGGGGGSNGGTDQPGGAGGNGQIILSWTRKSVVLNGALLGM